MPIDFNNSGSRSEKRAKRRKTNIILNTLIAIVIILIIFVGKNIFFSDNKVDPQQTSGQEIPKTEDKSKDNEEQVADENSKEQTEDEEKENNEEESSNTGDIEQESNEPNVEKVIVNPDWKPIGTEQTGHQPSYDMGSVDWKEKELAAAYAINTQIENMTTWWLRRGDDPDNQSILTVSAKGSQDTYEVYVEWVDGQGWKPTEVKKLIENDRRQ
ncbi:YrrS family protein [Lederbergia panacisoli]|uniref:YrrS family protein n=1 Tax=Lederbergia panacisoli TaxID=1255251 RepID=UPI00214CF600|nr:YrrS family protein [Lederbergia panacisoli]MCR2820480.1 YrrS family protein [Lederbergia panacisoli]